MVLPQLPRLEVALPTQLHSPDSHALERVLLIRDNLSIYNMPSAF